MRTRWIVALLALGAVLVVFGLRGGGGSRPPAPSTAGLAAAAGDQSTSTSTTSSSTSSSITASTISAAELESALVGVDELEQTQPLVRHLPYDHAHFAVDYHVDETGGLTLEIELRAILNRPEQLPAYEADLRAYKAEALEWLRSVGADPTAYPIEWRPPEVAAL